MTGKKKNLTKKQKRERAFRKLHGIKGNSARSAAKTRYEVYLQSDHWINFKLRKEQVDPKKCAACGEVETVQLHHMIYRTPLESAELDDTCWLCMRCHKLFHSRAGTTLKNVSYKNLLVTTIELIQKGIAQDPTAKSPWGAAFSKKPGRFKGPAVKKVKYGLNDFLPGDRVVAPECKMKLATVVGIVEHGRKGKMMVQIKWDPTNKQQHGKNARIPPERLLKVANEVLA